MDDTVRDVLSGIVVHISGCKTPQGSTYLYHDLGIAGDDAWELLEEIHKAFGTKFDELHFDAYFPNEGEITGYRISKLLGFKDKFKRFPFGHLVRVVEAGHWFEPEPTTREPVEASKKA